LEIGGRFGTRNRAAGWGPGLTILTALANVLDDLAPEDGVLALYHGMVHVASDCQGQPPRFALDPLPTRDVAPARLKTWFRRFVEVRDADGAERALLTAIASGMPSSGLADMLFAAATVAALRGALEAGVAPVALSQALCYAAALRIARFHTSNEFGDWITVLHTFTYCNALHMGLKRAPSAELARGIFHGAMKLYLD